MDATCPEHNRTKGEARERHDGEQLGRQGLLTSSTERDTFASYLRAHDRSPMPATDAPGGTTDNLKKTYDEVSTPALPALKGKTPSGTWTLQVADKERVDTGRIRRFTLEMQL